MGNKMIAVIGLIGFPGCSAVAAFILAQNLDRGSRVFAAIMVSAAAHCLVTLMVGLARGHKG